MQQTEFGLLRLQAGIGGQGPDLVRRMVAHARMADLALRLQVFEGPRRLLGVGEIVDSMELVQIQILHTQALQ